MLLTDVVCNSLHIMSHYHYGALTACVVFHFLCISLALLCAKGGHWNFIWILKYLNKIHFGTLKRTVWMSGKGNPGVAQKSTPTFDVWIACFWKILVIGLLVDSRKWKNWAQRCCSRRHLIIFILFLSVDSRKREQSLLNVWEDCKFTLSWNQTIASGRSLRKNMYTNGWKMSQVWCDRSKQKFVARM